MDWIATLSTIIALIAMLIAFFNLREMKNARIASSRANITVYFSFLKEINEWEIVIKNFGNSIGILDHITVEPPLKLEKVSGYKGRIFTPLTEITNLLLAPGQQISAYFPFEDYPDEKFNITVHYDTLGKRYSENFTIDLTFYGNIRYTIYPDRKSTPSTEDLLGEIATNISWLSRKFQ